MSTAALRSLFGIAGVLVAIAAFVLLGNPTSGGSVPVQMLSGGFQFWAKVLPNNAGVALVHRIEYFDGNQLGHPLVVLALYAVIATALCFAAALRRSRSRRPSNPARTPRADHCPRRPSSRAPPTCSRSHHEQGTSHPGHSGRTRAHRRPGVAPTAPRQGRPSSRPHSRTSIGVQSVTTGRNQRGLTVRHPECSALASFQD